jgi:hypothetical protein
MSSESESDSALQYKEEQAMNIDQDDLLDDDATVNLKFRMKQIVEELVKRRVVYYIIGKYS